MLRTVSCLVVFALLVLSARKVGAESYVGLDRATYFRLGIGGTHSPQGENFAEETSLAVSFMLDTEAATITYDSVAFSTNEVFVILEDNYTVDFGETVPITTTITLAPLFLASRNHNAFQLTPKLDGRFEIDHDRLRFEDSIVVTGRYDIFGPTESASHNFSVLYEMPSNIYLFPWRSVDTTLFPAKLTLETWKQNSMTYYDYPFDSEFSTTVDGADVTINLQSLSLRLDNDVHVSSVPEASTLVWDGTTNEWGTPHWDNGSELVSPVGGENMVVPSGWVDVEHGYTGDSSAASLLIGGGTIDVSAMGELEVTGSVTTAETSTLIVDGVLTANGGVTVNGLLSGSGTIVGGTVAIGGVLSPGDGGGSLGDFTGTVTVGPVPEPSSLALLCMGTLALTIGWWRRKR